jgi:hypothetical protein
MRSLRKAEGMPPFIGMILAAAVVIGGCGGSEDAASVDASRAAMAKILYQVRAALPNARMGDPQGYDSENLYEAVDGMAGYYIDAGFVRLARCEWRPADSKDDACLAMDLFDMGSPLGALDLLADSRTDKTVYAAIGNEAHWTDEMLELRTGRYYVKLVPHPGGAALKPLMKAVAEALVKAAPPGPADEALVSPLPADKMVPHSAAYVAKEFLGREFLSNVREAAYEAGGKRVRLFLMATDSPEKARAVFMAWKELVPPSSATERDLANMFTSSEEDVGATLVAHHGKFLVGAIGDPATARPLLESFLRHLG